MILREHVTERNRTDVESWIVDMCNSLCPNIFWVRLIIFVKCCQFELAGSSSWVCLLGKGASIAKREVPYLKNRTC